MSEPKIPKKEWIKQAADIYVNVCKWPRKKATAYAKELAEDTKLDGWHDTQSMYSEGYLPADAVYEDMSYWN